MHSSKHGRLRPLEPCQRSPEDERLFEQNWRIDADLRERLAHEARQEPAHESWDEQASSDAGVPCHVAIAPVVPQITDHEIEMLVEEASKANARGAFYLPVRLPHEVAPLFRATHR